MIGTGQSAPQAAQVVTTLPEGAQGQVVPVQQPVQVTAAVAGTMQPMQPMQVMSAEGGSGQAGQMVVVQQQVIYQNAGHLCCGDTGNEAVDHELKARAWPCGCGAGCCDAKLEMVVWGSLLIFYGLLSLLFAYGDDLAIAVGLFGLVGGLIYIVAGAQANKHVTMVCIPMSPLLCIYNLYEFIYYMQYGSYWFAYGFLVIYHVGIAVTFGYIGWLTYNFWKTV